MVAAADSRTVARRSACPVECAEQWRRHARIAELPTGEVALSFAWASVETGPGGFSGYAAAPPARPIVTNGLPTGYDGTRTRRSLRKGM
jgi:hypothetical protein